MGTLHRSQVIADVATRMGVSHSSARAALDAVLESVQESLVDGDRVVLTGFGNFEVVEVAPRRIRSIQGSRPIVEVPAHKKLRFKPSPVVNGVVDVEWYERLLSRAKRFLRR